MRALILSLLLAFFSMNLAAQQAGSHLLWQQNAPLHWHHFKGKPDTQDVIHAAVTFAGIDLQVEKVSFSGEISFRCRAVFDQQQSWVHPGQQDSLLLAHEQLHFDIAEVYARKLERKLNSLKLRPHTKKVARKLHQQYTRAQLRAQAQYDAQSMHGLHSSQQQAWRNLINRELRQTSSSLELKVPAHNLAAGHR